MRAYVLRRLIALVPALVLTSIIVFVSVRLIPGDTIDLMLAQNGELPSVSHPPSGCRFHPRCPKALPECSEVEPALGQISPAREVACHLHTAAMAHG